MITVSSLIFESFQTQSPKTTRFTVFGHQNVIESKAPASQLVNAEVNSGNRKAVLASNYTLQLRIRECHAGMKCDLKGSKHYSHCIWLSHDSKYKSHLTRKP